MKNLLLVSVLFLVIFSLCSCATVENSGKSVPTVSVEEQTKLIMDNSELWAQSDEYDEWFYTITDLDRNGRCEVIISSLQGSGLYTYSEYYEVNAEFNGIEKLSYSVSDGESQPDIMVDSAQCYYDKAKDTYHYVFTDVVRGGAWQSWTGIVVLTLKNGTVSDEVIASLYQSFDENGEIVVKEYRNAEGNAVTEEEYNQAEAEFFAGMESSEITLNWENSPASADAEKTVG